MTREKDPTGTSPRTPWYKTSYSPLHVFWVFLLIACFPAAYIVVTGAQLLTIPYETTRPEAFTAHGAQCIALHKPLYPPFGKIPYTIHVYNPLTYLPAGLAGRVFDLDLNGIRYVGRLISYLSTLLLSLLLILWIRKDTGDWKPALLAGVGIYYFHLVALTDFFRIRSEPPGLLYTFAGVVMFLSHRRHRVLAAAMLFFIAFLHKQSFVAAPISAFLFLLVSKDYRNALRFFSAMVGMLAFCFLTMDMLTGTDYFYNTIVAQAVNDVRPLFHLSAHRRFLFDALYSLILSMPIALALLILRRRYLYLVLYFFVSLVWTIYSTGKLGAAYNYYCEITILSLVIVAMALASKGKRDIVGVVIILSLLNFQVFATLVENGLWGNEIPLYRLDKRFYVERYKAMPGKKLITEERIAIHVGDVVGFDWFLLDILDEKGIIDFSPLYRQIAEGEYAIVVFPSMSKALIEGKIYAALQNGPYEKAYVDFYVVEYHRSQNPPE